MNNEIDQYPLKVSKGIDAIVIKADFHKFGKNDEAAIDRIFQVLLHITHVSDEARNELAFKSNDRVKLDVRYSPQGGEDSDYIKLVLCPGRRITFMAYEYIDNLGSNRQIVEIDPER